MTKPNYHRKIIQLLERLHKAHPTYNIRSYDKTKLS